MKAVKFRVMFGTGIKGDIKLLEISKAMKQNFCQFLCLWFLPTFGYGIFKGPGYDKINKMLVITSSADYLNIHASKTLNLNWQHLEGGN